MSAERKAAEERLLEASLRSLLGRAPSAAPLAARASRWLVAAGLVLGLGVVAATMCLQRGGGTGDGRSAPAQEPEAAPMPAVVSGDLTELAALPADVANLSLRLAGPRDLTELQRFTRLRRLEILSDTTAAEAGADRPLWRSASLREQALALAALAVFRELEVLVLPFDFELRPAHMPTLARLPRLHTLQFHGGAACDRELGTALCSLPALRTLCVQPSHVDAGFLTALAARPVRALALFACPGLDADAWRALAGIRTLRRLEVTCQHGGTVGIGGATFTLSTLDAAAFAAFAALPELRELLLDESEFDDALLSQLPARLELLDLGDRPMRSALTAAALRRLGDLHDLTFGCGLDPAAAIDLIGALRLRRLDYRGKQLPPELLHAIAARPDLVELSLKVPSTPIDYSPLVRAPRLESLRIVGGGNFSARFEHLPGIDELKPLRECRTLRRIHFTNCGLDLGAIAAELGPAIELTAHEFL